MVSHALGQGYADLHFLIPETIDAIDFGKGPYYSNQGNFATAGYVQFKTKKKLENSLVSIEAGQFNSFRTVGLPKLLDKEKHDVYLASEYVLTRVVLKEEINAILPAAYGVDLGAILKPYKRMIANVAHGYFITDLNANYTFKRVTVGCTIENMFNQEWNETQFATASRLANEMQSVEEIHFTPGTPFFFKGMLKCTF